MNEKRINMLKEAINTALNSENCDTAKLLDLSKELDELILEAMKEKNAACKAEKGAE